MMMNRYILKVFAAAFHIFIFHADLSGQQIFQSAFRFINSTITPHDMVYYRDINEVDDSGYILCGDYYSILNPIRNAFILKTDKNGKTQWSFSFSKEYYFIIQSILQASDGNYVIAGNTDFTVTANLDYMYIGKIDANGNRFWSKSYQAKDFSGTNTHIECESEGFAVAGLCGKLNPPDSIDFFLVKTDDTGRIEWSKTYGSDSGRDIAYAIIQTKDNGFIMAGVTTYLSSSNDFYLVKTDSLGNLQWAKSYGGIQADEAHLINLTNDGGYIIGGFTNSFGSGGWDYYLVKTDSLGNLQWSKTYGLSGPILHQKLYSCHQTVDGGYILNGINSYATKKSNSYLIKTDSNGNVLWSKLFGKDSTNLLLSDDIAGLILTSDNGYAIAGNIRNYFSTNSIDLHLVKTDNMGNSNTPCYEDTAFTITTIPATIVTDVTASTTVSSPITITRIPEDTIILLRTQDSIICCSAANFNYSMPCYGDTVNFIDISYGDSLIRYWDFGDGNRDTFLTETNPSHLFTTIGTFLVTLIVKNRYGIPCPGDSLTKPVTVFKTPPVKLGNDTMLCSGDSIQLNAGTPGAAYLWSTQDTTQIITVDSTGIYWVKVSACDTSVSDTINISFIPVPHVNFSSDTMLCTGDSIVLDAGFFLASYLWSTGDTSKIIIVDTAGIYWVAVTTCKTISDTINISMVAKPVANPSDSILICQGSDVKLTSVTKGGSYIWSTNETTSQIIVKNAGNYWLVVTDSNFCKSDTGVITVQLEDCTCSESSLFVPNAFTPKQSSNNIFYIRSKTAIEIKTFQIHNRWGQMVFETQNGFTNDINFGWDGTFKGKLLNIGAYIFYFEAVCPDGKELSKKGAVILLK